MSIRLATAEDFTALSSTIRDLYPGEIWDEAQYWKVISRFPTWLTENDGKVTASLVSEVSKGSPYIWSVATDPAYRGKGLATTLIKEFEKHYIAQGHGRAWLHTRVDNPAQKLYFDIGYRIASFEPNLYAPHIHGLIMRKRLV